MSKNKMQEEYKAAWENFGKQKNNNRNMINKNYLGFVNQKIMEVNQSCELGDSNFLNSRSHNRTMIVDQEQEFKQQSSLGLMQDAITQQSCCIIQDTDEEEDELISLYSLGKTKSTTSSNFTKKSNDTKSKKSVELRKKSRNSIYSKQQQSSISSIDSSSSNSRIGVKKVNRSKQNIGMMKLQRLQSSSSANNTTAHTTACNNTIITSSSSTSGATTPISSMNQIITPNQKGYKITVSSIDKAKKCPNSRKPPRKFVPPTAPVVQIKLQEQEKKQQMGGITPFTGTWKNRDAQNLVTTQKKVIYSGEEELNDYQQEVDKLKDYQNRFEFIKEEKKNIRFNNTTKTNLLTKKTRNGQDHRRIGRNLFTASSCEKSKNQQPQKGGESPSTVQFAAFKQKQQLCSQKNNNCQNLVEEKQLFKRAQTQISKYEKQFQDYSPYKPEIFAQQQLLRRKLQSNKQHQKLLFNDNGDDDDDDDGKNRFFTVQCNSLVTKKDNSRSKKASINFDQFDKSNQGNYKIAQSNRNIIDTNSPPFQTLPQPSMTSRNEKQNYFKTEISPSCHVTNVTRFNQSIFSTNVQQFNRNTPKLTDNQKQKKGKILVLSPNNIKPASQTPQVQPFSAHCANRQRCNITTPKASMGGIKHSMSSMNTPTSRFMSRVAVSSGKMLFASQANKRGDSSQKVVQVTNAKVHRPIPAYNTKLPKSSIRSQDCYSLTHCSKNFTLNNKGGGGGYFTTGASVGNKPISNTRSAFKPQASRKLNFASSQQIGSIGSCNDAVKSKTLNNQNGYGQNSSLNFNSGSNKKHRKLISEYAKTPFDKASALKREEFCDSSSGRKMSGIQGVAAFGGLNNINKFKQFIGHNDEVKKQLVFDNKSSIGSGRCVFGGSGIR